MPNKDITANDVSTSNLEVGYYRAGSNTQDETPKTKIKYGRDTDTFGPPRNWCKPVDHLPTFSGDYYIPGTSQQCCFFVLEDILLKKLLKNRKDYE